MERFASLIRCRARRDTHPDVEVAVRCRIAMAWHEFHVKYVDTKFLPDEQECRLVRVLIVLSAGEVDSERLGVGTSNGQRLMECYEVGST